MNKAVFEKNIENVRKYRVIKLVTIKKKRNYLVLVSEPNYHTTKFFAENLLAIEMKKTVHIKTDDIYRDIAEDVETRFGTSNFEIDSPLPKEKVRSNWNNER